MLQRRRLRLERCRRRDPAAKGFGLYRIVAEGGALVTGGGFTLTLERAEAWCRTSERDGGGARASRSRHRSR